MTPAQPFDYEDASPALAVEDDADTDGVQYPADVEAPEEVEAAPAPESELVKIVDDRTEAQITVDDFVAKVMAERNTPEPVYTPPPMTERQMSARDAELNAGRLRVKHFEEQKARAVPAPRDPTEGTSIPVFRPPDHVPVAPELKRLQK